MSAVNEWFYIRSISTGNVVTANPKEAVARAQVIVTKPALNDLELWSWKGEFLSNKATGLVLDIRKGNTQFNYFV
jgi:hypothetical protein